MKRLAAVLLMSVSGWAAGWGAQAQTSQDTLAEAVASALDSNPSMLAQRRIRSGADEVLLQARAGGLPSVSAVGSFGGYQNEVGEQFTGPTGTTFPRDGDSTRASVGLELRQSLFSGGAVGARREAAEAEVGEAEAELGAFEQRLILDVIRTYLSVQRAEQALSIRSANVDAMAMHVQAAQDRFDVGEVTRTDVSQAQARAARSRAELLAARAVLAAARAAYVALVGREPVQLAEPPAAPATPNSLEVAVSTALAGNHEVLAANSRLSAAEAGARAARGDTLPQLDLVGRAGWRENYWDRTLRDTDASIVAEFRAPIFKGGELRSKRRAANLEAEKARFDLRAVERAVTQDVTRTWHELNSFREAVDSSRIEVEAAEIALEGTQQELAVGERITLDVLDQEQELLDARLALIDAEHNAYVSAHELLAVLGTLRDERFRR